MIKRSQALSALAEDEFDVLVVGGGITGAGVALDAATRGYSVALLERADFASGTSSRSSKLIHGGLRYLQNFDLGLVREALLERQLMVTLAPHLVKPLPLVVPAFDGARPDRLVGVGLNLYDVMAVDRVRLRARRGRRVRAERAQSRPSVVGAQPSRVGRPVGEAESWSPERHRVISGEEVLELLPALAARAPTSGYLFYDCQADDVRLVLTVLGEAERFGAVCANRVDVKGLLEHEGRARGVRVLDVESGGCFDVHAANVINATGVWADELRPQELHDEAELPRIRPSRGTHITLHHEDLPLVGGAIVPAGAGRSIFALPWLGHTLVGTTDNDYEGPLDHIEPSEADIDYLLDAINDFFGSAFEPADLTGAFAGVRPLISTGDPKKSVDISRKAELYETSSGMITITGGKLTTWRRMAKMAVDRLVEREAREAPCRTHEIPLGQAIAVEELPRVEGVPPEAYAALASRYGHAAHEALALASERSELAQPIVEGLPDLLAEVALAARREQARSIGDVLLRRTRLGLLAARELVTGRADGGSPGIGVAVERVGDVLARELDWNNERLALELGRFAEEAQAEGIVADRRRRAQGTVADRRAQGLAAARSDPAAGPSR
ncbi:MAG: glycerol-3-phosphate dehydrogenase/oxidase [Solirubrobacteraceae bacterium]|jgi:glycerol-3-phosphate dehydrogenase